MEQVATTDEQGPQDDLVHFNQAARALEVSRKTIERMAKEGKLERPATAGGEPVAAHVTKRSLVAALEEKRGKPVDASRLSGELSRAPVPEGNQREFLEAVQPIIDKAIDAERRANELETKVKLLERESGSNQSRDELLGRLVAGSWRERRKARREAVEHLVRKP